MLGLSAEVLESAYSFMVDFHSSMLDLEEHHERSQAEGFPHLPR